MYLFKCATYVHVRKKPYIGGFSDKEKYFSFQLELLGMIFKMKGILYIKTGQDNKMYVQCFNVQYMCM